MADSYTPCPLWRRAFVMLYDAVAVVALLLLAALLPIILGLGNQMAGRDPVYTVYLLLVWFAYLGWCWSRGGMTLGMRAWRVRIRTEHGALPGLKQSAIRFLVSLLSAACLGLGFFWSLFEPTRRTWHDQASKTVLLWQGRR